MQYEQLVEFSLKADDLLLSGDLDALQVYVEEYSNNEYHFDSAFYEAQYYYALANCYSALYHPRTSKWYSPEMVNVAVCYRKALAKIDSIEPSPNTIKLKSMICTNLANHLSSQGRALCCIELYDEAIRLDNNPVAYVSKARNELFLADSIYDPGHREYHYYAAAKLIEELKPYEDLLEPEQRLPIDEGGRLHHFNNWFHENYEDDSFNYFDEYQEKFESNEQKVYLSWCAENRLFLNDLNDVCKSEIVNQDVLALSPFTQCFNDLLTETDELTYHGNYDEIKNDYCYARYLLYQAMSIDNDESHYFNSTFQHVDSRCGAIDNLKVCHLKSAFKVLYSIFDKIAYFIHRFFDLNDISKDNKIYIDKLFQKLNGNGWKPNEKLEDGYNFFINALFFILQDLRDVKGFESVSKWIDPNAEKFSEIRNAMEHRSLVVVDSETYNLIMSFDIVNQSATEQFSSEYSKLDSELGAINQKISDARKVKDRKLEQKLLERRLLVDEEFFKLDSQKYEKQKLSTHTLHITIDEFESRLHTLIKLVRNSIMYLSLAINLDSEMKKEQQEGLALPRDIPLR
jgi:hypothetical protein